MQPHVLVSRREAAGPQGYLRPADQPELGGSTQVGKLDVARADPGDQPQLANTPLRALGRSTDESSLPATMVAATPQVAAGIGDTPGSAAPGDGPPGTPAPGAISVARGDSGMPAASGAAGGAGDGGAGQGGAGGGPGLGGAQLARAEVGGGEGPGSVGGSGGGSIARAGSSVAAAAAGPIDGPAGGEGPAGGSSGAAGGYEASASAVVSKGSGGGFGGGVEANFGSGVSDTDQPAAVGSMAASRPANLQSGPEGPALAPSASGSRRPVRGPGRGPLGDFDRQRRRAGRGRRRGRTPGGQHRRFGQRGHPACCRPRSARPGFGGRGQRTDRPRPDANRRQPRHRPRRRWRWWRRRRIGRR